MLAWTNLTIPPAATLNSGASTAEARQLAAAGSMSVVPLVYGEDRIGGLILNVLASAAGPATIVVQCLWAFASTAVSAVNLNGAALPAGSTETHYLGAQTAADPDVVAAFAAQGITYTDTLAGYAYSVFKVPGASIGGELQFTATIQGRALYDPRLDSTNGGTGSHRLATPSTWQYSDNPSLATADLLKSTVYGPGETLLWSSVATAANANDQIVGGQPRRIIGLAFIEPAPTYDVSEVLRAYAGLLPFGRTNDGAIKFLPDVDAAPVATYTHAAGDIISISPLSVRDLGNSPTVVEVIYTDKSKVPWQDASAYAELPGAGTTKPYRLSQVRLPGIKRYSQANREAIERLNKLNLQDLSVTVEVSDTGIKHDRGDIVTVAHPIGISAKRFRIADIAMSSYGRWRLSLNEHDPASYSDSVATSANYNNSGAYISGGAASAAVETYKSTFTAGPATFSTII